MKMSKLGLSTSKNRSRSEESISFRLMLQAGLIHRYGAGIYGLHNLLVRSLEKTKHVIRTVLESYDCVEILLPSLQPQNMWKESGRWDKYANSGQMFICDMNNGTFCLAPTAEEAVLTFAKDSLKSYKSLPVTFFQIGPKFRNELRARGGLLRGKEFWMMDGYSFHSSAKSLEEEYSNIKSAYFRIFSELSLDVIPVAAVNGDMGGNLSEEFMFISDAGEDTMLVDESKTVGLNTELLEIDNADEYLKSHYGIDDLSKFTKEHCIELGHIFQLGQQYSISMGGTFRDKDDTQSPFFMGCYGIGITRTLAAVCEQNHDEYGLIWPKAISPYQLSIIYHHNKENEAFKLYSLLQSLNIEVLIDDRDLGLGTKIKDSKLLGIPYMVILGNKSQPNLYEVESRMDGTKSYLSTEALINLLKNF